MFLMVFFFLPKTFFFIVLSLRSVQFYFVGLFFSLFLCSSQFHCTAKFRHELKKVAANIFRKLSYDCFYLPKASTDSLAKNCGCAVHCVCVLRSYKRNCMCKEAIVLWKDDCECRWPMEKDCSLTEKETFKRHCLKCMFFTSNCILFTQKYLTFAPQSFLYWIALIAMF